MLTVIASLFSMIYQNLLQHLHFKAEYNKYDEILKKNKPMYINNEKWSELRKEAINTKIKKFDSIYFYNIETSEVYETLNSGKPNYLNDDEWKYLLKSAKESFKGRYSTFIKENFSILDDNIIKLLKIEKPINFPQKDWIDLLSLSNNEYIDIQKRKFHFNEENIVKEIERTKPEEILDIYWEKYIIFLKEKYTETILNRLDYISDINKYMKEQKIQFLDSSQKKTIEEKLSIVVFFKFLESLNFNMENPVVNTEHEIYLSDVDKNRAERIIAKIVNINFNIKKYEILVKYINEILKNIKLDIDKPSEITELEWTELNNLSKSIQQNNEYKNDINQKYEDITTEYAKIDKIKITLRNEEKYVEKIKCKIIKQLDILNEMINGNVNIIERVEDYEDIFSKGNFQNLLKLRLILKKNDIAETE
ncbi:hypothetical protein [Acetoanaerobium noterae]|uniref:hypothetical protein n=1 Tax=Acetoanaerobium noterae TaxID=745369 RepID=UPI003221AE2A